MAILEAFFSTSNYTCSYKHEITNWSPRRLNFFTSSYSYILINCFIKYHHLKPNDVYALNIPAPDPPYNFTVLETTTSNVTLQVFEETPDTKYEHRYDIFVVSVNNTPSNFIPSQSNIAIIGGLRAGSAYVVELWTVLKGIESEHVQMDYSFYTGKEA